MAAMSTTLTEFNDSPNERTYFTSGHTTQKPKMVAVRRRTPSNGTGVAETTVVVYHATVDADGNVLPQKVAMEVKIKDPVQGLSTDRDAVLVILRDIVAGDEFTSLVSSQQYLK
jgi:hypothetical protein